jgi:hypothetical protein
MTLERSKDPPSAINSQYNQRMPRMRKQVRFPSLADFRDRFLRILDSFYGADRIIAAIRQQAALSEQCVALLWLSARDSPVRLALGNQTERHRAFFTSVLQDALRCAKAVEFVYTEMDSKPHFVESSSWLRSDLLLKLQAVKRAFPPPKSHGRDRDWSVVLYAKTLLESLLQQTIPDATMAALLTECRRRRHRKSKHEEAGCHGR